MNNELLELLFQIDMSSFIAGYFFCMLSDALLSIISFYVERGLLARSFRRGRLRPMEGLDNSEISFYIAKEIKKKFPFIIDMLNEKEPD